ncbi:MAG: hypothetical protein ACREV0_04830 [Burkholderiales bacterium]
MREKYLVAACLIALSTSVLAQDQIPEPQTTLERIEEILSPGSMLRGQITEEDVSEIFALLRSAMAGKSVEPSERLKQKLDALALRLQIRGALAGSLLLDELEARMKRFVRELNQPPRDPNAI